MLGLGHLTVVEETMVMKATKAKVIDGDSNGEGLSARLRSQLENGLGR